jgi:hypothetical protein
MTRIAIVAIALILGVGQSAFALHAGAAKKHPKVYGYSVSTDQNENDADIKELFAKAAKDKASKLVVFGGLHGYDPSGEPVSQTKAEKAVCSFAMGDQHNKGVGSALNFTYVNVAKYAGAPAVKGGHGDVSAEKQKEILTKISEYSKGGYYVLVAWCFSKVWLETNGL